MNPVTTPVNGGLIVFELTDEDRKRLRNVKLIHGGGNAKDIIFHRMCIQQTVALLTESPESWKAGELGREITKVEREIDAFPNFYHMMTPEQREQKWALETLADELRDRLKDLELSAQPICVSEAINEAMVQLNDRKLSPQQRGRLKGLVEEIINTCPVKRTVRHYKTVPDKVEERPWQAAPGYQRAEKEREKLLKGLETTSFNEALKLIRQAAGIYKVTKDGLPGGTNNPIAEIH